MTARVAIYARYSTDLQREASIDDQVRVCRRYADERGWQVVAIYADRAASGGSRMRPQFLRLITDAEARQFDIVLCEAIDRLGRRNADLADLHDRLAFLRIALHTTALGEVTVMHMGVMGMFAQMQLSDLRAKTRRGQLGRVKAGRIPGGLAFGYDVVPPPPGAREAGERRINEAEAVIVRRIFQMFAEGQSPRSVARSLNAASIPGPGGREWRDTTIRGQVERGTGILNNTLYIGQLSWDRCSYVKDPRSGKRVARPNAASTWELRELPELRIIDQSLWDAVKARQAALQFAMRQDSDGNPLNRAHRRNFLLSGLLTCGCCGGGYTIMAKDRYGCATRRSKGTCSNSRTIDRDRLETRVLSGLKDHLLTPELVAEFVRAYADAMLEKQRAASGQLARLRAQSAEVERKLEGVLRAIEGGAWSESLRQRLAELETSKASVAAQIDALGAPAPVPLHPNSADIYRRKVADLEASLNDPAVKPAASEALRALIERIVLTPAASEPDGLQIELHGDLAAILRLGEAQKTGAKRLTPANGTGVRGHQLSVVAGPGFEPGTFRL